MCDVTGDATLKTTAASTNDSNNFTDMPLSKMAQQIVDELCAQEWLKQKFMNQPDLLSDKIMLQKHIKPDQVILENTKTPHFMWCSHYRLNVFSVGWCGGRPTQSFFLSQLHC
jgi:hypothetical protein